MDDDTQDSPRPLDWRALRPEGSSIHGFYGNDKGKCFKTASAQAVQSQEDSRGKARVTSRLMQARRYENISTNHKLSQLNNASHSYPICSDVVPAGVTLTPCGHTAAAEAEELECDSNSWCKVSQLDSCASWSNGSDKAMEKGKRTTAA